MTTTTTADGDRGHRWFAFFYDCQMRMTEKRLGPLRHDLVAGLTGDVLEIGAGTGANFEHYGPHARVVALEPDPHMLRRAQAKLATLGRTNIDVRRGRAESLPLPDSSFDAVVSTLVLCTVDDLPGALAEIRRVLRPGGQFLFIEHVRGERFAGRVHDAIQPVWGWCSAGCHVNRRTEDAIRAAGFAQISLRPIKIPLPIPAIVGTAEAGAKEPASP